ncbi:DUF1330 domain-containing protein [Paraburkholderia sp. RL18-103-BIB-C]|jgi:uncharacterized protein (DUF1330 family)|uniref:DUF1330 domain-containing protein n=1 Tax=unclassified Paraburkholderia TaxID=2615204 RepID=UPI002F6AB88D
MTAYAVAHLINVELCAEVVEYLECIDETLEPFGGRFVVHGARPEVREGEWHGDLIMIAFPDLAAARAWYGSHAYQRILPLRLRHASGSVILIDGVDERHKATDILG